MPIRFGDPPPCKHCGRSTINFFGLGRCAICDECDAVFCVSCAKKLMKEEDGKSLCRECWIVHSLEKIRNKK